MRSSHSLDRVDVAFDGTQLVADAGLLLPATLALHLGLGDSSIGILDLGAAAGRANAGDKLLTLVMSALAGGDCIDDADALRAGGTERVLGFTVKAPSTLGTFLRSFRWGHVRQLDRVSRELLAPGLGGRRRTRIRAAHDRSRLDDLRDVRPRQGGRPPPRVHRRARLPPAARRRGRAPATC